LEKSVVLAKSASKRSGPVVLQVARAARHARARGPRMDIRTDPRAAIRTRRLASIMHSLTLVHPYITDECSFFSQYLDNQ
jgi:hypothetical protein